LSKDFSYTTGGTSVKMGFGLLSAFHIILDAEHQCILRADNKKPQVDWTPGDTTARQKVRGGALSSDNFIKFTYFA